MKSAVQPVFASLENSFEAARQVCRKHARSFYFASHFLPRPKRRHAYAVYAFCRLLDDAVDEAKSHEEMEAGLARFSGYLDASYRMSDVDKLFDNAPAPLMAFAQTVRSCAIPRQYFDDLAHGCRMDLSIHRYQSWAELERYCYHVAGVVGLIMCRVFELKDEGALSKAVHMGNAMQLTNILRDVGEDFRQRGRIYLPLDEAYDGFETDIAKGLVTEKFKHVMTSQIARARSLYAQASEGLSSLERDGSRQTACVMSVVYAGILGAIERNGLDCLSRRASISLTAKLLRLPKAISLSRRKIGASVADVF